MKKVTVIRTFDGKDFDSVKKAYRYLDDLQGNKISRIALNIRNMKYAECLAYLEEKLPEFKAILEIREDMKLVGEEDEIEDCL